MKHRRKYSLARRTLDCAVERLEQRTLLSTVTLSLSAAQTLATGVQPRSIVVSDVNGDGIPDLLVGNSASNTVEIFLGKGNGVFAAGTAVKVSSVIDLKVVDLGNGHPDIIASGAGGKVSVLLGNGTGKFSPAVITTIPNGIGNGPDAIDLADLNGDSKADLIIAQAGKGTIAVLYGNGDGTFAAPTSYSLAAIVGGQTPYAEVVVTGDFNGDNHMDIAVADGELTSTHDVLNVFLNNGDGTFSAAATVPVGLDPTTAAVADLGNGKQDIVVADRYSSSVEVLLGNGDGTFAPAASYAAGNKPFFVTIGDVTGDGIPDIVVADFSKPQTSMISSPNGLLMLPGNGDGTFSGAQALNILPTPYGLAVADVYGDGKSELLVTDRALNKLVVLRQATAPTFTSADTINFAVGAASKFTVTTNAFPAATITDTLAGSLPAGITFVKGANGTATLTGTPRAGSAGAYVITFTAGNGVGTAATQTFTLNVGQATAISSVNHLTVNEGSSNSFSLATSGNPAPTAFTETGALPADESFDTTTGILSGTPTASGVYHLTLGATNGFGKAATQVFTLTVDQPPAFTSATSQTFPVGLTNFFGVTTTGFPVPALGLIGALPAGVTFRLTANGTASLAGKPLSGTGGTYNLTFTASNGIGPKITQQFTLEVDEIAHITTATKTTFLANKSNTFTFKANAFPVAAFTESGTLPTGVTFVDNGNNTATLGGAPTESGTFILTINALENTKGQTEQFTLVINQPPEFNTLNNATFTTGTNGSFGVVTVAQPGSTLTASGALPKGVLFSNNSDHTGGSFTGTPQPGSGGTYKLLLRASNGLAPMATQTFTLTINEALLFTSNQNATFSTTATGLFHITTLGFPKAAFQLMGAPTGITLVDNHNDTANLTGKATTGGIYNLTILATNTNGSMTSQQFTLTVKQPVAITTPSTAGFATGTAGTFSIATSGFPNAFIASSGLLPNGLTLTDHGDGTASLTGTPTLGGVYHLTISASNHLTSARQALTITVDQPLAFSSADNATFTTGKSQILPIKTAGFPLATLSETGTLPTGLKFTDDKNGAATLSGIAAAGTGGTYVLTLSATNANADSTTQTFTLTVDQPATLTSPRTATFTSGTAGTFNITTSGFPTATLSDANAPAGLLLTDNLDGTGSLTGTLTAKGTFHFTLTAFNAVGLKATQVFTLIVN